MNYLQCLLFVIFFFLVRLCDLKIFNNILIDNFLYQDFWFKGYLVEGFFNFYNLQYKRNLVVEMNGMDMSRYFGKI